MEQIIRDGACAACGSKKVYAAAPDEVEMGAVWTDAPHGLVPPWAVVFLCVPFATCDGCESIFWGYDNGATLVATVQRSLRRLSAPPPGHLYHLRLSEGAGEWEVSVERRFPTTNHPVDTVREAALHAARIEARKREFALTPEVSLLQRIADYRRLLTHEAPSLLIKEQRRLVLDALRCCCADPAWVE